MLPSLDAVEIGPNDKGRTLPAPVQPAIVAETATTKATFEIPDTEKTILQPSLINCTQHLNY